MKILQSLRDPDSAVQSDDILVPICSGGIACVVALFLVAFVCALSGGCVSIDKDGDITADLRASDFVEGVDAVGNLIKGPKPTILTELPRKGSGYRVAGIIVFETDDPPDGMRHAFELDKPAQVVPGASIPWQGKP